MSLPEKGWKATCNDAAAQLRRAAVLSDDAGHALREVAFLRWKHAEPVMAEAVLLWMHNAMESAK